MNANEDYICENVVITTDIVVAHKRCNKSCYCGITIS